MNRHISGFVCLHKPPGIRSFPFLSFLKKKYPKSKIGHAGTLDEFAEGLLIACIGTGGKLVQYCTALEKHYCATIRFGIETDTLDPLGVVIKVSQTPSYSQLMDAIASMEGVQEQMPPDYSALKIEGTRASTLSRLGISPRLTARKISISHISVEGYDNKDLRINFSLSKGAYVRAFARDLAHLCKSTAHVHSLCRTGIGPFTLAQAANESNYEEAIHLIPSLKLNTYIALDSVLLSPHGEDAILQGKELKQQFLELPRSHEFLCVNQQGTLMALVKKQKDTLRYSVITRAT